MRVILNIALIFCFCCGISSTSNGQILKWVYKIGGTSSDVSKDLCLDKSYNEFDVSVFSGSAVYATTATITSRGSTDIILRKNSAFGNFLWYRQIGSKGEDNVYKIVADQSNNIYISGTFTDSLYVGSTAVLSNNNDGIAAFILKFDNDGGLIWAHKFESELDVSPTVMEVSKDGFVYIGGNYRGNTQFSPLTVHQVSSAGGYDMFLTKLGTLDGSLSFVETWGSTSDEYVRDMSVDSTNQVVMTGDFRDILDFDPSAQEFLLAPQGFTDCFLMKVNAFGALTWAKSFGGEGLDGGYALKLDNQNKIILTGKFSETVNFGSVSKTAKGGSDIFITKLDQDGNIVWVDAIGSTGNDQGTALFTSSTGLIYVGCEYRDTVDFNISIVRKNASISNGGSDISIVALNQDGSYNAHYAFGGIANDIINGIAVKPNGEIISAGGFGAVIDFDPSSTVINVFSSGGIDGYVSNVFLCINPYLKTVTVPDPIICYGERGIVQITEGYLNHATQWSWQKDSCDNITFASGTFLNLPLTKSIDYYIKGWGGCVVASECTKASIKVHTDTLKYQNIHLCQGDTVHVGNHRYFAAGTYVDSLVTMAGCDSLLITDISILPSYMVNQNISICQGDTLYVGSNPRYLAGFYSDNLLTAEGCDSIIATQLTLKPANIDNAEAIICKGDSIRVGNETYTSSGQYIQSSINSSGCEDLLLVNIIVLETEFDQAFDICQGEAVTVGSHVYTEPGKYTDTFVSGFGCDSIITTNVKVHERKSRSQHFTLCQGDSVRVGNSTYQAQGVYIDTLSTSYGCDSIVTSTIDIINSYLQYDSYIRCPGDTIFANGRYYTESGIYQDTFLTILGCDSIIISDISIKNHDVQQDITLCQGDTLMTAFGPITIAGSYSYLFQSAQGCDSIHTYHVTVNPTFAHVDTYMICPGDTIEIDGDVYSSTGVFVDTFQNVYGCDSLLITQILYDNVTRNIDLDLCDGQRILINGKVYDQTGIFVDTLKRQNGCDSILNIQINVYPKYIQSDTFRLCKGESIKIGNSEYFNAGDYNEYLTSVNGCDSLIQLHIELVDFDVDIWIHQDTLFAPGYPEAVYTWLQCFPSYSDILGETTQPFFKVTKDGEYQVSVTYNGCIYITDCKPFVITSTDDVISEKPYLVPNPAHDHLFIHPFDLDDRIYIYSADGRLVFDKQMSGNSIEIGQWPSGSYVLKIIQKNHRISILPFVKL